MSEQKIIKSCVGRNNLADWSQLLKVVKSTGSSCTQSGAQLKVMYFS